eukprot:TRINITY_DN16252_c0_g1_i2.p1 TRINITY_DN16252_c0_g1~~TRINITY_DN16252_c0_g1_i2.p1  ORF type:complete len:364 (+),score=48.80 TRINITY_DN16252_c0_g1_i2:60-1151(+)
MEQPQQQYWRVRVPSPVKQGQTIAFVSPDGQQLSVNAERNLEAGAVVDVPYVPAASAPPQVTGTVLVPSAPPPSSSTEARPVADDPAPIVHAVPPVEEASTAQPLTRPRLINGVLERPSRPDENSGTVPMLPHGDEAHESDRRASCFSWILYVSGCCCFGLLGPMSAVCWIVSFCSYFCRSRQRRLRFPMLKRPAIVSLVSLSLLAIVLAVGTFGHGQAFQHLRHWLHKMHHRPSFLRAREGDYDYDYDYDYDSDEEDDYSYDYDEEYDYDSTIEQDHDEERDYDYDYDGHDEGGHGEVLSEPSDDTSDVDTDYGYDHDEQESGAGQRHHEKIAAYRSVPESKRSYKHGNDDDDYASSAAVVV